MTATTTNWKTELKGLKRAHDAAYAGVAEAKDHLRDVAAALTYDLPIEEVSSLVGWSVAYLRKLRGRDKDQKGIMSKTTYTPKQVVSEALQRVDDCENELIKCRAEYIRFMRDVIEPAPSMSDLATVVGVSRQRISQLLTE
jgi:hypothetical protein